MTVIFSFGNLFAWMMPKKLKAYFNGEYEHEIEKPLSEKELMEIIKSQLSKENNS